MIGVLGTEDSDVIAERDEVNSMIGEYFQRYKSHPTGWRTSRIHGHTIYLRAPNLCHSLPKTPIILTFVIKLVVKD